MGYPQSQACKIVPAIAKSKNAIPSYMLSVVLIALPPSIESARSETSRFPYPDSSSALPRSIHRACPNVVETLNALEAVELGITCVLGT